MRHLPRFAPHLHSQRGLRVLLLAALFAVLAIAPCMAQAPAAGNPQAPAATLVTAAPATTVVTDFLATLSTSGAGISELLPPRPAFLSGCTSSAQCPKGQLCCLACGFSDCDTRACFQPVRGGCPQFQ